MFDIEFSIHAEKQLSKLKKEDQIRILSTLERIRIRPYPHVKGIVGSDNFRLRVGKFRVIIDIRNDKFIIFVIEIANRNNIYKKL